VAAEGLGAGTVENSDLTAHVEATGAARIGEGGCRGNVTTTDGVETNREADGSARTSDISFLTKTLVKVVNLDVIVDLAATTKAEAHLERRGKVGLNTVLVDLNIGVPVNILSLAEETRAGVHDTLESKASLHLLAKRGTIDDVDVISILSLIDITSKLIRISSKRSGFSRHGYNLQEL